ncbi:hypothetical protein NF27_DT01060 [Candidatus Jidaibacter acanthamoeba]|uniref:Methyltransferase type 11 domain-containing protein n=2 Tax=Candidatus Jidaibacter acanthamoebae TaxID=86105 RepID=A0A0C1MTA8_9RICK|nr:hypothetical protein NF27_DT01060 [Candidatus Jidaibacter acanthamoeba]
MFSTIKESFDQHTAHKLLSSKVSVLHNKHLGEKTIQVIILFNFLSIKMQVSDYSIFDREFYKLNIKRCVKNFKKHDFLVNEVSENVAERIREFSKRFDNALIYGLFDRSVLDEKIDIKRGFPVYEFTQTYNQGECIVFDEEYNTCIEDSYDLIISNLSLSFVNDLPGALIQYKKILKKGGVFIATLFGGDTLKELKDVLIKTDSKFYGGSRPHIIPFIDIKDGAALLQRAGFTQAISDSFNIIGRYSSIFNLLRDIKGMGQSNCLSARSKIILPKNYFSEAEEIYKKDYNLEATFEVITITGFKA